MKIPFLLLSLLVTSALAQTTVSFYPPASADDGVVWSSAATWPPAAGTNSDDSTSPYGVQYTFVPSTYYYIHVLVRFDTSALPDNATITSAVLKIYLSEASFPDGAANFKFQGGYYTAWPIEPDDYVPPDSMGSDAFLSTTADEFTPDARNSFSLSNLGSISKTGYTGFRFGLVKVGGNTAPPGQNFIAVTFVEYAGTDRDPLLEVTYVIGGPKLLVVSER